MEVAEQKRKNVEAYAEEPEKRDDSMRLSEQALGELRQALDKAEKRFATVVADFFRLDPA